MPFRFSETALPGVVLVEADAFPDERGFFMETYKASTFSDGGIPASFVQDNHSRSRRHVFRGLHYQNPPAAQGKLVSVIRGEVLDVAVDIRRGSPTYGRWIGEVLSEDNRRMLYVPEGFAHGFGVLSDAADVVYKVTSEYSPDHDRGVAWDDPEIGMELGFDPLLSDKDRAQPRLADADNRFVYEP